MASGLISRFPIDLRRRPYNTLALPCECVIHNVENFVHSKIALRAEITPSNDSSRVDMFSGCRLSHWECEVWW